MRAVVLDGYTLNPGDLSWEGLEALCGVTVYERTKPEEVLGRIGDAQIVLTNKTLVSRSAIAGCPNLKFIAVLATGYNVVDTEAAKENGIVVSNVPSYGTASVAQYVFALLLEICHHVQRHSDTVMEGRWSARPDFCYWDYPLIELAGKTMGIVGFGKIGRSVAKIAVAFGMKVLAYDVNADTSVETAEVRYTDLHTLFNESDVISLHCPLFPQTRNVINEEAISKMKDGVIVINTARGPLVDEKAMRNALERGKVGWFAADVVSSEPIGLDNPLLGAKNAFITPHIAWAPRAARKRLMDITVENVKAFIAGNPINAVNQ